MSIDQPDMPNFVGRKNELLYQLEGVEMAIQSAIRVNDQEWLAWLQKRRDMLQEELASELGISVEQYQQAQREIHRRYLELKIFWMELGVSMAEIDNTPLNVLLDLREMLKRKGAHL